MDEAEETGTLAGRTIAITAGRRADEQVRFFERRGATTLLAPAVRAVAAADEPGFLAAVTEVIEHPGEVVLLQTGTGVRAWFAGAAELGLVDELTAALRQGTVYARGPKSARAAIEHGLEVAWQSPNGRYRDLVARVGEQHAGARVVVQLDGELDEPDDPNDPFLVASLHGVAGEVVAVPVYRWALPVDREPALALARELGRGAVDAVTFTSSPAVTGLLKIADEAGLAASLLGGFQAGAVAASIGEVCTGTLRRNGIESVVEPDRPRLGALLLATAAHLTP